MFNWNTKVDLTHLQADSAGEVLIESARVINTDLGKRYVAIDDNNESLYLTDNKWKKLSFENVCKVMNKLLSDQTLSIERKRLTLKKFEVIKNKFEHKFFKEKANWIAFLFFWRMRRKSSELKEAQTIITEGFKELLIEENTRKEALIKEIKTKKKNIQSLVDDLDKSYSKWVKVEKAKNIYIQELVKQNFIDDPKKANIKSTDCLILHNKLTLMLDPDKSENKSEEYKALSKSWEEFQNSLLDIENSKSININVDYLKNLDKIKEDMRDKLTEIDELKKQVEELNNSVKLLDKNQKIDQDLYSDEKLVFLDDIKNIIKASYLNNIEELVNKNLKEVLSLIKEIKTKKKKIESLLKDLDDKSYSNWIKAKKAKNVYIQELVKQNLIDNPKKTKIKYADCLTLFTKLTLLKELTLMLHPDKSEEYKALSKSWEEFQNSLLDREKSKNIDINVNYLENLDIIDKDMMTKATEIDELKKQIDELINSMKLLDKNQKIYPYVYNTIEQFTFLDDIKDMAKVSYLDNIEELINKTSIEKLIKERKTKTKNILSIVDELEEFYEISYSDLIKVEKAKNIYIQELVKQNLIDDPKKDIKYADCLILYKKLTKKLHPDKSENKSQEYLILIKSWEKFQNSQDIDINANYLKNLDKIKEDIREKLNDKIKEDMRKKLKKIGELEKQRDKLNNSLNLLDKNQKIYKYSYTPKQQNILEYIKNIILNNIEELIKKDKVLPSIDNID